MSGRIMRFLAWAAACLCLVPILAVALAELSGSGETWARLAETVSPRYPRTNLAPVVLVSLGPAILLTVALFLATLERDQRGAAKRYPGRGAKAAPMLAARLRATAASASTLFCALPIAFGFLIPVLVPAGLALDAQQNLFSERYLGFMRNSLLLATIAAVGPVTAAVVPNSTTARLKRSAATRSFRGFWEALVMPFPAASLL